MHDKEHFDSTPQVKRKLNRLPENPEAPSENRAVGLGRFPSWLHRPLPKGSDLFSTNKVLRDNRLHTVCEEAKCPNLLECYSRKTATFLVMGKECTRSCGFCDIDFSKAPMPLSDDEPMRVADSVQKLGLKHVVITMVARDDLPDGGAAHLCKVVEAVRQHVPETTVELLTSDFNGLRASWDTTLDCRPEIFNHNIETVRELTPRVRHKATYDRTLSLLKHAKASGKSLFVKSGIMVGLGETDEQVHQTLQDLYEAGCDIVTIGQYLQASRTKLRLQSFVTPEQFSSYEAYGHSIGIKTMYCGPFIRSSYNANLVIQMANGAIQTINSV
jgi:lipoic acid synthetase